MFLYVGNSGPYKFYNLFVGDVAIPDEEIIGVCTVHCA